MSIWRRVRFSRETVLLSAARLAPVVRIQQTSQRILAPRRRVFTAVARTLPFFPSHQKLLLLYINIPAHSYVSTLPSIRLLGLRKTIRGDAGIHVQQVLRRWGTCLDGAPPDSRRGGRRRGRGVPGVITQRRRQFKGWAGHASAETFKEAAESCAVASPENDRRFMANSDTGRWAGFQLLLLLFFWRKFREPLVLLPQILV